MIKCYFLIVEKTKIGDLGKTAEGLIKLILTGLKIEVRRIGEEIKSGDKVQIGELEYIINCPNTGKRP